MAEQTQFTIGAEVECTDGVCGEVQQVVVDPLKRTVTHLVVEPKHRVGLGRLVPLSMVDAGSADTVRLSCTVAEFDKLDLAEETLFSPGGVGPYEDYSPEEALSWPYFGLVDELGVNASLPFVRDALPVGEVAVRRGDRVHATDGEIGHVEGLVIDRSNDHVTHVLLQEGHLWDRKDVAIPISAVTRVDDSAISVNLSKEEVGDLPAVDVDHPGR